MADAITISALRAKTHIGVTPEERAELQEVVVNVCLAADLRAPGRSDALEDTIDYAEVAGTIASIVEDSRVNLLENLAETVAGALLRLEHVTAVTVEIAKDPPPVVENVQNITVRIERP